MKHITFYKHYYAYLSPRDTFDYHKVKHVAITLTINTAIYFSKKKYRTVSGYKRDDHKFSLTLLQSKQHLV